MNTAYWLIAGMLAAAPVAAAQGQAGSTPAQAAPNTGEISKEEAEKKLAQCGSKQFQATAEFEVDGKIRRTGLRVCAQPGDSDAAWIERLEKAAAQVEAQASLPESAKAKLAGDVRNEIARLKTKKPAIPAADALVATVPAMPTPKAAPAPLPLGALGSSALPSAPPPLSIRCLESGEHGKGRECDEFKRNTVLMVQADADLKGPATLRFLRKGDLRSELSVQALRQGQVKRVRIPGDVCKGVVRSQLEIEIVGASASPGSRAGTEIVGPYMLRC